MGWKNKTWLEKKYKDNDKVDAVIAEKTRLGGATATLQSCARQSSVCSPRQV